MFLWTQGKRSFRQLGEPAAYEQLAEESAELAQAALKMARLLRGENPTPVKKEVALGNFREELADVACCMWVLGQGPDGSLALQKMERWMNRIQSCSCVSDGTEWKDKMLQAFGKERP